MADDEINTVREITKNTLMEVFNQDIKAASDSAEIRGTVGARLKGLQESHGLNLQAYRIAKTIRKQPNGKREQLYRAVLKYCDMLDVEQQKDIEDVIREQTAGKTRTDLEKVMDGQPPERQAPATASIYTPQSDMGRHTLRDFELSLDAVTTHELVNTGLEHFSRSHPRLADEALAIATRRITAIDAEAGGGEDLRAKPAQEAGHTAAAQAAEAGKKTTARKTKAKPTGDTKATSRKAAGAAVH